MALLILAYNKSTIESYFQINRNDSNSSKSGVGEQIKSVTNITSDVSNLERLNRWKCAVRMGLEKPIYGFGPGTYQFQYLPFQRKNELTRISVKSPYYIKEGRGGTAHSEYLLSFSESGWLGLMSWLFLIFSVFYSYLRIFQRSSNSDTILLAQAIFAGMVGFFIHAFFNNFLNTPNFALYFWFLMGLLLFLSHQIRKEI
jgi:O-antigen ligase